MKRGKTRRVLSLPSYSNPLGVTDNGNGYHQFIDPLLKPLDLLLKRLG